MDDLMMTKACADAMRLDLGPDWNQGYVMLGGHSGIVPTKYDPLKDDAQAMALVKKFRLEIVPLWDQSLTAPSWCVKPAIREGRAFNPDLNRAIVECVAKMHAKVPA